MLVTKSKDQTDPLEIIAFEKLIPNYNENCLSSQEQLVLNISIKYIFFSITWPKLLVWWIFH